MCGSPWYNSLLTGANRLGIDNLLRLFWSTIDKTFEATRSNIAKHYTRFERSRQYSVDSALIHNSRKMMQMLPTVTVLPSISSGLFEVPLLRNPHFSERGDDEVSLVRTYLNRPTSDGAKHQSACLVQGLGGVGKTTIALEYAYRYRDEYDFVFWIPAETDLDVSNTTAIVSRKLGLGPQEGGEKNPQLEVERFRSWLETLGGCYQRPYFLYALSLNVSQIKSGFLSWTMSRIWKQCPKCGLAFPTATYC